MRLVSALVLWLLIVVGVAYGAPGDYTTSGRIKSKGISTTTIQLDGSGPACSTDVSRSIRWSDASNTLQICTGSAWVSLPSTTTAGGGSGTVSGTGVAGRVATWSDSSTISSNAGFTYDATAGLRADGHIFLGTSPTETLRAAINSGTSTVYARNGTSTSPVFIGEVQSTANPALIYLGRSGSANSGEFLFRFSTFGCTASDCSTYSSFRILDNMLPADWTSTSTPSMLRFYTVPVSSTASTERLRINASGEVGINTTNPSGTLDVSGSIQADHLYLKGASLEMVSVTTNQGLRIRDNDGDTLIRCYSNAGNGQCDINNQNGTTQNRFVSNGTSDAHISGYDQLSIGNTVAPADADIYIQTDTGGGRLRVSSSDVLFSQLAANMVGINPSMRIVDSMVGIGIATPTAVLDVSGSARLRDLSGGGNSYVCADADGDLYRCVTP